eukprot:g5075.t1
MWLSLDAQAYNPTLPEDGWRAVVAPLGDVEVGASSCCVALGDELIVASGRPPALARKVAGFRFAKPPTDPLWFHGSWRQLPDLDKARVGGAMAVVDDYLYITGGVDETTGEFHNTAERLAARPRDVEDWQSVPWFQMPRALHAHNAFAMPYLE